MNQSGDALAASLLYPSDTGRSGLPAPSATARSNAEIGRDFMELSFRMESGRPLPTFTRFEGPITVRLAGPAPAGAATDLARLLQRLRNEAGVNIRQIATGDAAITIEFVPRKSIQTSYANVACFVVPRVSGWAAFRAGRRNGTLDWASLNQRERVSIFIPADSPPQEVRDCLHEETAQAIGPLNDLFRLTDSVFNDDNFHTSLTAFDMTILRAYYAPELHSGMNEQAVALLLPGILSRINPAGNQPGSAAPTPTPRAWVTAIETALGSGSGTARRNEAARQALNIARAQGWTDGRLAFSYFALGRLTMARDPATAVIAFTQAGRIYRTLPGGEIHVAHVDMQLAAFALSQGDPETVLAITDRALPVIARSENASLMATMMLVKAEALTMLGRGHEATALRIDSQGWARYGFGSDAQIRVRSEEISALARRGNKG